MYQQQKPNHPLIFWIIWIAILQSVFLYQYILAGGPPSGEQTGEADLRFVGLCIGFILLATIIRWFMIPKTQPIRIRLVLMIIGLCLAEAVQLFQIFLIGPDFPKTQMSIFVLSILSVVQFAPFYVKRQ